MPKIDAREEKRVRGKERAKIISSEKESKTCVAVFVFFINILLQDAARVKKEPQLSLAHTKSFYRSSQLCLPAYESF